MPDNIYFLATGGGVTFGGGEPLLYADFISEFTRKMPEEWKITIESSLNVPNKNIFKVAQFADLLVIDIKDMDEFIYKQYTGKDNSFVLANLKWLVDNGYADKTIIRIPLIKNYNNKSNQIKSREILESIGFSRFDIFIQMLPYFRSMEAFSHFDFSLYNEIDSSKKTTSNICSLRKKY